MRKNTLKSWGEVVVQVSALCVKSLTLRTGKSWRAVCHGYKASSLHTGTHSITHQFIHHTFRQFSSVSRTVMPIIPSPYKENNKLNKTYLVN